MVSIIPSARTPFDVLGEDIGRSLQSVLPGAVKLGYQQQVDDMKNKAENRSILDQYGPTIASLPRDIQKLIIGNQLQNVRENEGREFTSKENELNRQNTQEIANRRNEIATEKNEKENVVKQSNLSGALETVNRMKELRKKGNLGRNVFGQPASYSFFDNTRQDASEYEQLGKSLIQYATNIPIRNRIEFETLAEKLYDPDISDASAKGILNAMERILNNSFEKNDLITNKTLKDKISLEEIFK